MGMFSWVGDIIGDVTGTTKAGKAAEKAAGQQLGFQQQGLDYLKETQEKPLEYRDLALDKMGGFYGLGGEDGQQEFIDETKASPFYESTIDQGRQGVGAALSATGNIRGGAGPTTFYQQDQNVLQNMVNQRLQGFKGFAQQPINAESVAQQYGQMGATQAGGTLARGRSTQDAFGMALDFGKAALMI